MTPDQVSPAFAGCTQAFIDIHLANPRCIDGQWHDGPCLLTDASRADEALGLLKSAPLPDYAASVEIHEDGTVAFIDPLKEAS